MKIIDSAIKRDELIEMLPDYFGDMVKAVVDIERNKMGLNAELHADIEKEMLAQGSSQYDLWGINLYPDQDDEDFIEFDSLINIRPGQGNRSRGVQDPKIRERIVEVVNSLIQS